MKSIVLVTCLLIFTMDMTAAAQDPILFQPEIANIFEQHCVRCHNNQTREGGLSLQSRATAMAGGESGKLFEISADTPSLLLELISGSNPAMPKDAKPLPAKKVAAIRAWIDAGADWPAEIELTDRYLADRDWWSMQPIKKANIPNLTTLEKPLQAWARTPIDHFILNKQAEFGLLPSTEATRQTLVRRLYFDLLGLPPTPEEVHAFLNDDSPTAYENLVDRLLASPQHGERWARHWLDVVKYADTCGYDKDKLRPNAWPYRDYVIDSFNEDKPYARFVEEQIAGDVLFPNTRDGILGLGFVAAGPWDFIGHVEVSEEKIDGKIARHIDRDEMVTNTLNTFCSLTIQCARCHNHKFDPFTQQHYYSLQAVFAAVDKAERPYDLDPETQLKQTRLTQQLAEIDSRQAELTQEIIRAGPELVALDAKIAELKPKIEPTDKPPEYGYHSYIVPSSLTEKWVQIDLGREVAVDRIILNPCHDEFNAIGSGFGFPLRFRLEGALDKEHFRVTDENILFADMTTTNFPNPRIAPVEFEGRGETTRYLRLTATHLAPRQNDYMLAISEIQILDSEGTNVALGAQVSALDSIENPVRWRKSNLVDGKWPQATHEDASAELLAVTRERTALYTRVLTPERRKRQETILADKKATETAMAALPKAHVVYAAATDFSPQANFKPTKGKPRTIHVLHRGNINQPGPEVQAGTVPLFDNQFEFDLPPEQTEGDRRAALARWITRPDHPLTWRSIINRLWLYHFGRGIVASPNDFGRMGQKPTHPLLLDWMASQFRDHGQSLKQLHRLIVNSATYRQTSDQDSILADLPKTQNASLSVDQENHYLWRARRRRLEAEEIRDSILTVSGRMDHTMGGPGYYLFELERPEHSPHYEYYKFDPTDSRSHRRSVYRFIVRSQPDPYMTTLDCADSSQSTPQRGETLTSLQALSLLNNRFNLTMSQYFAERAAGDYDSLKQQVKGAFELALNRKITDLEHQQLMTYAEKHGLENTCRLLFNLSEFVFID